MTQLVTCSCSSPTGPAPAINTDDTLRDGAWIAESTGMIDLSSRPAGVLLILRKERPHPGAQRPPDPKPASRRAGAWLGSGSW